MSSSTSVPLQRAEFWRDLERLHRAGNFNDMTVCCSGGSSYRCNSLILAAVSPLVADALVLAGTSESVIVLPDFSSMEVATLVDNVFAFLGLRLSAFSCLSSSEKSRELAAALGADYPEEWRRDDKEEEDASLLKEQSPSSVPILGSSSTPADVHTALESGCGVISSLAFVSESPSSFLFRSRLRGAERSRFQALLGIVSAKDPETDSDFGGRPLAFSNADDVDWQFELCCQTFRAKFGFSLRDSYYHPAAHAAQRHFLRNKKTKFKQSLKNRLAGKSVHALREMLEEREDIKDAIARGPIFQPSLQVAPEEGVTYTLTLDGGISVDDFEALVLVCWGSSVESTPKFLMVSVSESSREADTDACMRTLFNVWRAGSGSSADVAATSKVIGHKYDELREPVETYEMITELLEEQDDSKTAVLGKRFKRDF